MKARNLPKQHKALLTEGGQKIWNSGEAALVDRKLLYHYILACNAMADVIQVEREIDKIEADGKTSTHFFVNVNGVGGIHPLRQQLEKCRRAYGDERKKCGLDIGSGKAMKPEKQDILDEEDE